MKPGCCCCCCCFCILRVVSKSILEGGIDIKGGGTPAQRSESSHFHIIVWRISLKHRIPFSSHDYMAMWKLCWQHTCICAENISVFIHLKASDIQRKYDSLVAWKIKKTTTVNLNCDGSLQWGNFGCKQSSSSARTAKSCRQSRVHGGR